MVFQVVYMVITMPFNFQTEFLSQSEQKTIEEIYINAFYCFQRNILWSDNFNDCLIYWTQFLLIRSEKLLICSVMTNEIESLHSSCSYINCAEVSFHQTYYNQSCLYV